MVLLLSVVISLRDVVLLCVHMQVWLTWEAEEEQDRDTSIATCKGDYEEHKGAETHMQTHTTQEAYSVCSAMELKCEIS